jgi:hypothetical protein
MGKRAKAGTLLSELVTMAVPLLQEAQRHSPRTGPGAKPDIPDWVIAALIMAALLSKKKTKSAQFRFLCERRRDLAEWLGCPMFPSRATYFRRYRRGHRLYAQAIRLQGQQAIQEGVVDPKYVAVDKSLLEAQGPPWHVRDRQADKKRPGVDTDGAWGYSEHHGWVYGYSYEVVVSATPRAIVFPLLASVDSATAAETKTVVAKIALLPDGTQVVLADSAYDANAVGEQIEYDAQDRRSGRRFLCPEIPRHGKNPKPPSRPVEPSRVKSRQRRLQRRAYRKSPRGRRLYARRQKTVEPFNQWFKSSFELNGPVWHRGLDNNRTQILAAIFAYQLLVRYNHRLGNNNGAIRWLLDAL